MPEHRRVQLLLVLQYSNFIKELLCGPGAGAVLKGWEDINFSLAYLPVNGWLPKTEDPWPPEDPRATILSIVDQAQALLVCFLSLPDPELNMNGSIVGQDDNYWLLQ